MKFAPKISALGMLAIPLLLLSCTNTEIPETVSIEDYKRAEFFLSANTSDLVYGQVSSQTWITEDKLIYKTRTEQGIVYVLVDITGKKKEMLFDTQKLMESLSKLTGKEPEDDITLYGIELSEDGTQLTYSTSYSRREVFTTDLNSYETTKSSGKPSSPNEILSPDSKKAAYIKDHNLWIRDTETGVRTQLTFDGIEDYGYSTNNAGWTKRSSPVLLWSPQSDKIATFRHDGRKVGEMYLWSTKVGHPNLEKWKYPLPGDSAIFMIERVVIHLGKEPKLVKLQMPPDAHRSTTTDHIAGRGGEFLDVEWSEDGEMLAFVSSSRDHKIAHLQVANPYTGSVRSVHREVTETYFESGVRMRNWHILKESNEVIWYSEKSNWGHLYLYDLTTGELKNQITTGEWAVLQLHYIDKANRKLYILGSNREDGDPYFQYLYSINFDGSGMQLLTPGEANHSINWSPSNTYFTDSYSTPTDPGGSVIRNTQGDEIVALEEGNIEALLAAGWVAPEPFTVLARDRQTMLYGLMYKPSNFDAGKKYPILNYLYPGPQSGSVGSRSFRTSRSDKQSLAELGFIVVEVDAMGTPGRSKSFHDIYYGNMGDNGLPDQMTMIEQLAERNEWMDLEKVGIWGHSGGGFASTDAILRYPDFYKVAVSGAGNHDNRNYEDDWGEKWHGLLTKNENAGTGGENVRVDIEIQEKAQGDNYDKQANQLMAGNLKGKLLIAHGMLDGNVHPSNTLLVVDALIKADKDFDMLVFPNARHGFGNSRYFLKRRWDYFVKHLKGIDPPEGFVFEENIR